MISQQDQFLADERDSYEKAERGSGRNKDLHAAFVELYVERSAQYDYESYNDMLKACYLDAGFSAKNNGLLFDAKETLRRCMPEIEKAIRQRLTNGASLGAATLVYLCRNAKQEAVRLKAATELLNKAGYAETQKIQVSSTEELTDEELQAQIRDAMEATGLRVVSA
jgi:hypothetical protein